MSRRLDRVTAELAIAGLLVAVFTCGLVLGRGIERGELRHGLDPQLAASAFVGPILFRRLLDTRTPVRP